MYAFVKFTDGGRLVMPISMIKKFRPRDDQDCNPKQKLEAFWISEKGGEEGYYEATVEMLGGTVELLIQKMQKARVAVPRILNNLPEGGVGDSMQKKWPVRRLHRTELQCPLVVELQTAAMALILLLHHTRVIKLRTFSMGLILLLRPTWVVMLRTAAMGLILLLRRTRVVMLRTAAMGLILLLCRTLRHPLCLSTLLPPL
ncbi:uncharacterized protein LOC120840790 isoform X3 [Ixodes scapularis]|uniref:uncharacterized protein LOC120840790 isoform X3 n=1 Tax=Ixodes scapularis TaxID=6945 RepID=UPI001A9E7D28|nr:uncharacterized protein LOC120840790 isoform X3 [Ixodes scapularis]